MSSLRIQSTGVAQTRPLEPQAPAAPPPPPPAAPTGFSTQDTFQAGNAAPGRVGTPTPTPATTAPATTAPATTAATTAAGGPAAPAAPTRAEPLTPETNTALQARLASMPEAQRTQAQTFLNQNVLNTPNADRAVRTYLDLTAMQATRPDRLSTETVETLTRGVAEARGTGVAGQEGIMGPAQARDAARALVNMTGSDFAQLQGALRNAGTRNGQAVPGADAQAERALILKAVGARANELSSPGFFDRVRNVFGGTTAQMDQVTQFARDIAGTQRAELINQSTAIDVNGGDGALQQRFNDSCVPTSAQMAHADADPVYARQLHREAIHGLDANTNIGREQRTQLEANGGIARERTATTGASQGVSADAMRDIFNGAVGPNSHRTYATQTIADTPADRQSALDRADRLLRDGVDVPIAVLWNGGGGHALMMSDVRGQGTDREYLVTDPWNGRTNWIKGSDIAAGNTNFGPGTGRLGFTFE